MKANFRYTAVSPTTDACAEEPGDYADEGRLESIELSVPNSGPESKLDLESRWSYFRSCRFQCIVLCWLANIVCYVDRINISVGIIFMSEELGWSQTQQGFVLSSFFYGYILTQILAGK